MDGTASTGAVTWSWRDANNLEIANTPTVTLPTLSAGVYEFTLTVSDGPCTSTDVITITVLALPIAEAGDDQAIFLSETVTLGGNPAGPMGSTFTWTPDSLLNADNVPNPVADPTVTTWFALTVVAPNGCVDVDSVLITVVPTVVIPNGFTPNADGRERCVADRLHRTLPRLCGGGIQPMGRNALPTCRLQPTDQRGSDNGDQQTKLLHQATPLHEIMCKTIEPIVLHIR